MGLLAQNPSQSAESQSVSSLAEASQELPAVTGLPLENLADLGCLRLTA
jgi:hypothetical protein